MIQFSLFGAELLLKLKKFLELRNTKSDYDECHNHCLFSNTQIQRIIFLLQDNNDEYIIPHYRNTIRRNDKLTIKTLRFDICCK